jgi:hypothetical protein
MKIRLYIWVTSDCNLHCPYCIQEPVMALHRGYQMSMEEVIGIVKSCQDRGIHFDTIELTGGEASMWENLEFGVKVFGKICNTITLATNGNNAEKVIALGLKTWIVSESQATPSQMLKYKGIRGLTINKHSHKKMPTTPMPSSLPAICCTRQSPQLESQVALEYVKGRIWHCPDACSHVNRLGLNEEEYSCRFEDDFMAHFSNKTYDKEICQYCLGNQKVWNQL